MRKYVSFLQSLGAVTVLSGYFGGFGGFLIAGLLFDELKKQGALASHDPSTLIVACTLLGFFMAFVLLGRDLLSLWPKK